MFIRNYDRGWIERYIRLFQLRTKYKLALYQFVDKQLKELLKNPEEIEKKFVSAFAEIIHNENPKKDSWN